jgi:cell shape-determining protein MreC
MKQLTELEILRAEVELLRREIARLESECRHAQNIYREEVKRITWNWRGGPR